MEIGRKYADEILLGKKKYKEEILDTFGMLESKPFQTPRCMTDKKNRKQDDEAKQFEEQINKRAIGSLSRLATNTRPGIGYAFHYLSQNNNRPTTQQRTQVEHPLRYVSATRNLNLN